MKFIHLSDLHIGKRLNDYLLIDDQEYMLKNVIDIIVTNEVKLVLISGDIYDTTIPSQEAIKLFDDFIVQLNRLNIKVIMISGNHDSKERLQFASRIIQDSGIYIRTSLDDFNKAIIIEDINIYCIPFIKPSIVSNYYNEEINSYDEMMSKVVGTLNIDKSKTNVLLTHQFVTGGKEETQTSESEIYSLGGLDNVNYQHFKDFDYVALGHVHRPQRIGEDYIRYSGSLLKYSVSEVNSHKSLVLVDLSKDKFEYELISLKPLHDVVVVKGYYNDLVHLPNSNDYVQVKLLDTEPIIDIVAKLRKIYPLLLGIDYKRVNSTSNVRLDIQTKIDDPYNLFSMFYKFQNGVELSVEQSKIVKEILEEVEVVK